MKEPKSMREPKVVRSIRVSAEVDAELTKRGVNVSEQCDHFLAELIKVASCPKCGSLLKKKLTK